VRSSVCCAFFAPQTEQRTRTGQPPTTGRHGHGRLTSGVAGNGAGVSKLPRRLLELAEEAIYIAVGVVLVASAVSLLVAAGYSLVDGLAGDEGTQSAVEHALDALLLAFIFVELLGAVRTTLVERALVAEPFLLVGIIASIKEIVVLGAFESDDRPVEDVVLETGTLAGVILALALAAYLVRRKEREPSESDTGTDAETGTGSDTGSDAATGGDRRVPGGAPTSNP
jgi:uncharacterized membrane protein (DUF373 family)